jgi:hypothetical protein
VSARPSLRRRLLDGWLAIAAAFGEVQTLVLMFVIYFGVMGPFALAISAGRGDLLGKRGLRQPGSAWRPADSASPDLERAKHTF